MAQLAEQLTCNQQVIGSSPIIGFQLNNVYFVYMVDLFGWVPEWPKGADCKSVSDAFEGSNPSPSIGIIPARFAISELTPMCVPHAYDKSLERIIKNAAGWSSLEARRAHNPKVIGSNPIPAILFKIE